MNCVVVMQAQWNSVMSGVVCIAYSQVKCRGLSFLSQVTVMGSVESCLILQSKRATLPLLAERSSGTRTIRVGSERKKQK